MTPPLRPDRFEDTERDFSWPEFARVETFGDNCLKMSLPSIHRQTGMAQVIAYAGSVGALNRLAWKLAEWEKEEQLRSVQIKAQRAQGLIPKEN